jgi:hypothetical protein
MIRSNCFLEKLSLFDIKLNTDTLGPVLSALEANSTLVCLGLSGSFKNEETVKMMIEFIQNSCNSGTSRLKELHFPPRYCRTNFHGYVGKPVTAAMLVGSGLEIFETSNNCCDSNDNAAFFNELTENVSATRLNNLRISGIGSRVAHEALARFLRLTTTLRHLSFFRPKSWTRYPELFLSAVRQNGSLHSFSLDEEFRADESWWLEHISSYCKRNQEVPQLLRSLETDLPLFPSLLAVTRPATRTATSTVFLGLFSCSDAIGPFKHDKRVSPP